MTEEGLQVTRRDDLPLRGGVRNADGRVSIPSIQIQPKTTGRQMQNENRRRPERWRSGIGISVLTVERFSPLMKGTAFAGANCRGWKAFLWRVPPFLCAVKEMGVHIKRKRRILRNHRSRSGIIPPPSRLCSYGRATSSSEEVLQFSR